MARTQDKIELLKVIAHRFNETKIVWALGASMLLYFKGITSEFHDIDLMVVETDIAKVQNILSEMGQIQPHNPNSKYQTKIFLEYIIDCIDVDVMAGFSIIKDGKAIDCSLKEDQIVERMLLGEELIPLQDIRLWLEYYRLMDRHEKVQMIERAMRQPNSCFPKERNRTAHEQQIR